MALDPSSLEEMLRFERWLTAITSRLVGAAPEQVRARLTAGLQEAVELFDVDRSVFAECSSDGLDVITRAAYARPGVLAARIDVPVSPTVPWVTAQLVAGRTLVLSSTADLPPEAVEERAWSLRSGIKASLMVPILIRGTLRYYLSLGSTRREIAWPEQLIPRLRLLGEIFADAFERARTELLLRESEARFRLLAENVREAFWIRDVDTREALYVSPGYEAIWGRSIESLLQSPRSWLDAVHPEDLERVVAATRSRPLAGTYDDVFRIVRPDGLLRWVRARAFPVPAPPGGRITRLVGVVDDITDAVLREERIRSAQRLEAVGRFAGSIAHDFNNLLMIVAGNASLLGHEASASPAVGELVEQILVTTERGTDLVKQLVAFSRQQPLALALVDFNQIIGRIEAILRSMLGAAVVYEARLTPGLRRMRADASQMEQVLINLVVNARDAMPEGGRLIVATSNVDLDEAQARQSPQAVAGEYVMLTITDSGSGMNEETRSRMFDPFFTTKGGKGTGLGLATVAGIVDHYRGTIAVETALGRGTTFRICFPSVQRAGLRATDATPA